MLAAPYAQAQLLSVDIDGSTTAQNLTAAGYNSWRVGSDLSSATGNRVATRDFTNAAGQAITCTVAETTPSAAVQRSISRLAGITRTGLLMVTNSPLTAYGCIKKTGQNGFHFVLQYSVVLFNWTTWTNFTATVSAKNFIPPGYPHPSARFFSAVSVE